MADDLFIGRWEMDPAANEYEFGAPPVKGLYIIEPQGAGYLVTMQWTSVDGKEHEMAYEGIADGEWYPVPATPGLTMSMSRDGARTLISEAKSGDVSVAYGRRELDEVGDTMTIYQSGTSPDGKAYTNKSIYTRLNE